MILERYKSSFEEGDRKEFYELVQQCVEQLLVKGVECKSPDWREVTVWKKRALSPADAEKRIREHVRPRLQEARRLIVRGWWATWDINKIGDFVNEWFGGEA